MIEDLHLRELGVIDEAVLELGPGLTVITGETGAGKTMVLTGLALLWGGRADSSVVRAGASKASVDGQVSVTGIPDVIDRVEDAGGEVEVDKSGVQRLVLGRTVASGGGSKAYVGGRAVPAGVLADLGSALFAVHGQDDQQRLMNPKHQRSLLDAYAGEEARVLLTQYRESYARLRELDAVLDRDETDERQRLQELDLLAFGIDEVDAVAPQAGEDVAVSEAIERLGHAESLASAAAAAHTLLHGDDLEARPDALSLVSDARQRLDAVARHDSAMAGFVQQLDDVVAVLGDVSASIAAYLDTVESDPNRLDQFNDRRAELTRLTRKYGTTIDEVIGWREDAGKRLDLLRSAGADIEALVVMRGELVQSLSGVAAGLSEVRQRVAREFEKAVMVELHALSMPEAVFRIDVRQVSRAESSLGHDGIDEVEFLLAAHTGGEPVSLARSASGGERSRVLLAIEVVLAGADPVPTMVFDEVDAGVGGRAAVEVGRRLARLARTTQVLVVTHLPQVAAFGDQHIRVTKGSDGRVTRSSVTELDSGAREGELARMLAGLEDSQTARAHAAELLEMVAVEKSSWTTPKGRSRGRQAR